MTNQLNEYTKMINNNQISIKMLLSCIANLDVLISKSAYMLKKYQHSYVNQYMKDNPDSYENRFKRYMTYRNEIMKVLNNPPLEEIREIIKGYEKSDIVSNQLRDQIIELIRSKDFLLIE